MWTKAFWLDGIERGVKTGAQAVLLAWGVDVGGFADAFSLDWGLAGGVFLGGIVISLLFSVASAPFADKGTASLVSEIEYK